MIWEWLIKFCISYTLWTLLMLIGIAFVNAITGREKYYIKISHVLLAMFVILIISCPLMVESDEPVPEKSLSRPKIVV